MYAQIFCWILGAAMAPPPAPPPECPRAGCGGNSPTIDGASIVGSDSPVVADGEPGTRAFHELDLDGSPNAAGFTVTGARRGRTTYTLALEGAVVTARREGDAQVLSGADLVGLVVDASDADGEPYAIEISSAAKAAHPVRARGEVWTYALTYSSPSRPEPRPLCTTGTNQAILFTGDRYDAVGKTVVGTGASTRGWMQIACAGTALAKLFWTRHTEASQEIATTAAERQAMLKMLTADVCGDGTSFTVHGQPLVWADANGLTSFVEAPPRLEALWSEEGALCLDEPRRPELGPAITARCGARLPRCSSLTHARRAGAYVTSANPR